MGFVPFQGPSTTVPTRKSERRPRHQQADGPADRALQRGDSRCQAPGIPPAVVPRPEGRFTPPESVRLPKSVSLRRTRPTFL